MEMASMLFMKGGGMTGRKRIIKSLEISELETHIAKGRKG